MRRKRCQVRRLAPPPPLAAALVPGLPGGGLLCGCSSLRELFLPPLELGVASWSPAREMLAGCPPHPLRHGLPTLPLPANPTPCLSARPCSEAQDTQGAGAHPPQGGHHHADAGSQVGGPVGTACTHALGKPQAPPGPCSLWSCTLARRCQPAAHVHVVADPEARAMRHRRLPCVSRGHPLAALPHPHLAFRSALLLPSLRHVSDAYLPIPSSTASPALLWGAPRPHPP